MNDLRPELAGLGDALERAAADGPPARARAVAARRLLAAAVVLAIAVPGLAVRGRPADQRTTRSPQSMPAGTLALAGTEPTCTVVVQDVEFHCVLTHPPAPEVSDWMGTVEPTVDATKHVNGGCRSLTSDGLEWQCYIGEAAVDAGDHRRRSSSASTRPSPGVG